MTSSSDSPGIKYPPPIVYITGFSLGLVLDRLIPASLGDVTQATGGTIVAIVMACFGFALVLSGIAVFMLNRTAVYPSEGAASLVTSGVYRFTRNPMYLGLAILYVAGSLFTNELWPLVLLPVVVWFMGKYIIAKEERHLEARFGEDYAAYRASVRRWI